MKQVALITGASSGIGRELAKIHASRGGDLVIVARRRDELEVLKEEITRTFSVEVIIVLKDLSISGAAQEIFQEVQAQGIQIDYLINNAGFGGHGFFHERELVKDEAMIQVNILALTALTRLFLPDMICRGSGRILNVASAAAFLPGPLQAVYYATKAYVLSFSQAIAEELSGTGVTVTALCPGAVDTGFAKTADVEKTSGFNRLANARQVAQMGYEAMLRGDLVAFNQFRHKFLLEWVLPLVPRRLVLKISRQMMEKS